MIKKIIILLVTIGLIMAIEKPTFKLLEKKGNIEIRVYDLMIIAKTVVEECYDSVINGIETENVIKQNSDKNYRKNLNHELNCLAETELWTVGRQLRKFRV